MRNSIVDISKGLLIILMVIGHSGSPITNFIYTFHMTTFIFLSGFVFNGDQCPKTFLRKRLLIGLYLPYVINNIFFILLFPLLSLLGWVTADTDLFGLMCSTFNVMFLGGAINELVGPLWYLVLIIEVSTLYYCLNRIFINKNVLSVIVAIFLIFGFILLVNKIFLPRYIGIALITLTFFHLGRCVANYYSCFKFNYLIFILSVIVLIYASKYNMINIGLSKFGSPFVYVLVSLSGIYFVLFLSKLLAEFKYVSILIYIGKKSIIVLVWHLLFFKFVTFYLVNYYNLAPEMLKSFPIIKSLNSYLWMPYTIIGVLGPLFSFFIFDKSIAASNKFKFLKS